MSVVIAKKICYANQRKQNGGAAVKTLLIVDFQEKYATSLQALLEGYCQVLQCQNTENIPETIANLRPDYLIMDFCAPDFEGFTLLRTALAMGANPSVIAIGDSSLFFNSMCSKLRNICTTVSRPVSSDVVASRLTCMMELPDEMRVPLPTREEFLEFMLQALGIPTDWAGGKSLMTIIPLAADHPEMKMMKSLYPAALKDSGDSVENVERNIRKAIDQGFHNDRSLIWPKYFQADKDGILRKPSNTVFIKLLADILHKNRNHFRADNV